VASGGINGLAVGTATIGGLIVYAGFRGISPLQALRDISSGAPPPVEANPTTIPTPTTPAGAGTGQGNVSSFAGGAQRQAVVAAARSFAGDKYSQAKRRQPGFSDCSSFVGKALRKAGIKPPGSDWPVVSNFWVSGQWKTIPASQVQAGDIALNRHHMVIMTSKTQGIGQQRPGRNVQTGNMGWLFGSAGHSYKTWTGYAKTGSTSGGGGGGGGTTGW
jgi:cell wall-associated NlpC family hydrolase